MGSLHLSALITSYVCCKVKIKLPLGWVEEKCCKILEALMIQQIIFHIPVILSMQNDNLINMFFQVYF